VTGLERPHEHRFLGRSAARLRSLMHSLGQFVYGLTVYDMVRNLQRERAGLDHLFLSLTFGDLLGLPVTPTCHTLRLLPYVLPHLGGWRRRMSREHELLDLCAQELS